APRARDGRHLHRRARHRHRQAGLPRRGARRRGRPDARPEAHVRPGKPAEPRQARHAAISAEKRLKELGIDLGKVSSPIANYVNAVRTGNLLFLAGKGPRPDHTGKRPSGKVGRDYTADEAYQHARTVGLDLLAVMRSELGSLDRVKRVVKLLGMVNALPEFTDHPRV